MRRDIVYYYNCPLEPVFNAFVQAANQRFGKDCQVEPCKTLKFGLNYSFKYNMNGGVVTAHFMPYQNGTAIDLHYTIVQAFGGRYKAHAEDLTEFVNGLLQTQGSVIDLDPDSFTAYEQQAPAQPQPQQPQPQQPQPQQQPVMQYPPSGQPQMNGKACPKCGTVNVPDALFCVNCGNKLVQQAFCVSCGSPLTAGANFCPRCGAKQR